MADWSGGTWKIPSRGRRTISASVWLAWANSGASLNCIRSNPNIVGHSMTGTTDCGDAGEGIVTLFRQPKPGTADAIFDGWYPLRWCLFVEPVQVYRGRAAHLEAVLANEDVLRPGKYPARVQVVGPGRPQHFRQDDHDRHSRIARADVSRPLPCRCSLRMW